LLRTRWIISPPGGDVTVEVSREKGIAVRDRGPGVPVEDRARVFQRFWRGRNARHEGAGLGLAIVAEIVSAHGGPISVADNEDKGAVFRITLPGAGL
jgi:signal transduction histidine kinase